ncbi:Ig-like domain-containing protein [Rossellomorea marisflavi]|uniref:Ig-like domain-containing protein n=1 Tax=Rossellomorea marisflavi TaxID=189381 RepID=UPI003511BB74
MKKVLVCLFLLCLVWGIFLGGSKDLALAASKEENDSGRSELKERVIVKLKEAVSKTKLDVEEVISPKEFKAEPIVTMVVPEGKSSEAFIEELEKQAGVEYAEVDELIQLDYTPRDPYLLYQWHHNTIDSKWAWNKSKGSSDITVAVIDNGVDVDHPEFSQRIVAPYDTVYHSTTITKGEHGTHVAGIIGAAIDNGLGVVGVAPKTNIMPIDVFYDDYAYTSDVIEGVYYAVNNGADIINMSLGSYNYNYSYNQAVQYAHQNGVLVIAAAGNDSTTRSHYPSSYDNVISVASTTSSDELSYFSNYGFDIDIAAPGSDIFSTLPYNSYGTKSGTSMASPVVAGVAALILADSPNLTGDEVADRLYSTSDNIGSSFYFGSGRVNASRALGVEKKVSPPSVSTVYDHSSSISGVIEGQGKGTIKVVSGSSVIATGNTTGKTFNIPITKQKAGSLLSVTLTLDGVTSDPAKVTVLDGTPPSIPVLDELADHHTVISGTTEAGANVEAKVGNKLIGKGIADQGGHFTIEIEKQVAGTTVEVTAIDRAGNKSAPALIIVLDKTPPSLPVVTQVGDNESSVKGSAEANSIIRVFKGSSLLGSGVTAKDGKFTIEIGKQKAGTELTVTSTDNAGNVSEGRKVLVIDKTPPSTPIVNKIGDSDDVITGKSERDSQVVIKIGTKLLATGKAGANGTFTIGIKKQKSGVKLSVFASDQTGNKSESVITTVIDNTAPNAPVVNEVTDKDTKVTGKAESGAYITIMAGQKKLATGKSSNKGTYSIAIKKQKAGVKLSVTATDESKNKSKVKTTTVKDKTPPSIPTVNPVHSKDTTVKGTAESGSKIVVKAGNSKLGTAVTNKKGQYSVKIKKQKKGTLLKITAEDKAKNISKPRSIKIK